jgi:hypothetical protein
MILATLVLTASCALPQTQGEELPKQEPTVLTEETADPVVSLETRSLATLDALRDSRKTKLEQLQRLRDQFDPDVDSERRLEQLDLVREIQLQIRQIEYDFESVATGIDVRAFDLGVEQEFDIVKELEGLLEPVMAELRAATETPREIERLRSAVEYAETHESLAREAIINLQVLIDLVAGPETELELHDSLLASRVAWDSRLQELINRRTVATFQLEQRLKQQESVLDSAQTVLGKFFRTRGLNLLLAASAFLGIWLVLRTLYRGVSLLARRRSHGERKFYARLIDVFYFAFSGIAAIGGALLVLYSAGDWTVLGLAILLFLGLTWASKTAIPIFFEQIRLLLNLGTVREGERVVLNGLPWYVARLSMSAILVNSELSGGRLRVPLRDMTALRSRHCRKDEAWFPTSVEDWVLLDGERLARVVFQSPEIVRVECKGGSRFSYSATDFMALGVENLSSGFRIRQRFGIDYEHQAICTGAVPELMHGHVLAGLHELVGAQALNSLKVEFLEASASSLDYAILADFKGEVATDYMVLQRALQRLLVEACNAEGWIIPFTQLTVHTASPVPSGTT